MGACVSTSRGGREVSQSAISENESINLDNFNTHMVHPDIRVHTVISHELDFDHRIALDVPLGDLSDEQLVAELSERQLSPDLALLIPFDLENHLRVMKVPLEAVTDDELMCEVIRRKLNIHDDVDEALVLKSYELGRVIGHGASGKVYRCRSIESSVEYACKVIHKDARMNDAQSMSTEVEIMKRIRHENVVSMFELFQNNRCIWMILELVDGGDLRGFLTQNKHLYTEAMVAAHMKQIFSGVHHLHSMGVIHRDLKLENILLKRVGDEYVAKIADFGLSALVRIGEDGYHTSKSSKRKSFDSLHEPWGTAEYEAPELLMGAYGPQADMWALGCMLYELLSGSKAFFRREDEKSMAPMHERIKRGEVDFKRPVWWTVNANAKDLIVRLLDIDPTKRLSATQAMKHRWIRYFVREEGDASVRGDRMTSLV